MGTGIGTPCDPYTYSGLFSLPKTVEFSLVLSNTVVETARAEINAIPFIFCEIDVRPLEIRITALRKRNQNR